MEEVKNVLPWRLPEDHPVTDACAEGLKEIGQDAKLDYWIFATDMSLNSGRDKKPSIGYSPMQEQYAHTPYDKVRIDLDKKTEKRLSFSVGERGQIFGFATAFGELLRRFDEVERISMESTEEDYLFMVVIRGKNDEYYLVSETEIVVLLEGALRIPSQR